MLLLLCSMTAATVPANSGAQETVDSARIVRILFTNNSNGKLTDCNCPTDPFGGLGERVALIREYKEAYPRFLLLDSGGYLGLTRATKKSAAVFRLMESMGYAAYGIGDQELYYSLGTFLGHYSRWKDSILSATILDAAGELVFEPYRIFTESDVRVAVIGLSSGETFRFFPDDSRDFSVADPDSVLGNLLPVIERESDYIVVLSQMGRERDQVLAKRWPGIDLIIGGHSQTLIEKAIVIGDCRIVQAGKGGGRVGEIVLRFGAENKPDSFSYKLLEVGGRYSIPDDILSTFGNEMKSTN